MRPAAVWFASLAIVVTAKLRDAALYSWLVPNAGFLSDEMARCPPKNANGFALGLVDLGGAARNVQPRRARSCFAPGCSSRTSRS